MFHTENETGSKEGIKVMKARRKRDVTRPEEGTWRESISKRKEGRDGTGKRIARV